MISLLLQIFHPCFRIGIRFYGSGASLDHFADIVRIFRSPLCKLTDIFFFVIKSSVPFRPHRSGKSSRSYPVVFFFGKTELFQIILPVKSDKNTSHVKYHIFDHTLSSFSLLLLIQKAVHKPDGVPQNSDCHRPEKRSLEQSLGKFAGIDSHQRKYHRQAEHRQQDHCRGKSRKSFPFFHIYLSELKITLQNTPEKKLRRAVRRLILRNYFL